MQNHRTGSLVRSWHSRKHLMFVLWVFPGFALSTDLLTKKIAATDTRMISKWRQRSQRPVLRCICLVCIFHPFRLAHSARKKLRAETRSPRGCEYFNNLLLAVWWRGYTTEWAKRISLLAGRKHALVHTTFIRSTYVSRRQSLTVKSTTGPNGWYFRQQWISKERQYDKTNPTATLLPNKVDRACNTKHSWNRSNQTWS